MTFFKSKKSFYHIVSFLIRAQFPILLSGALFLSIASCTDQKKINTIIQNAAFESDNQITSQIKPTFIKKAVLSCGRQPKQVLFSPDNACIVLPLLDDKGFQVISLADGIKGKPMLINPPHASKLGFVEGLFIPEKKAFFVSQMTTGNIYEYEYPGFAFKRTISTEGTWSKFIAWSSEKQMLAVSNWVSNDVSLIDYNSGKVLRKLKTAAAPRGLVFLNGGDEILVLCFDGGAIQKFNTKDGTMAASLTLPYAAMRHVVVNKEENTAYISDMHSNYVYAFDLRSFSITKKWAVFNNPNTLALLEDRYVIVSSRGPNNPIDYTRRSPMNGKISIIDVYSESMLTKLPGGNQPTGLAVSSNGKYLCFSNFQDANIELYEISKTRYVGTIPFCENIISPFLK